MGQRFVAARGDGAGVADGVWVRQSEWVWSNAIAVCGDDGLVLVDR